MLAVTETSAGEQNGYVSVVVARHVAQVAYQQD